MSVILEDIPYNLHAMVNIIGMDKFIEVSKIYGGNCVYIPIHRKVVMGERNRKIIEEYNGKNIDKLRIKYQISEQQIKRLIN